MSESEKRKYYVCLNCRVAIPETVPVAICPKCDADLAELMDFDAVVKRGFEIDELYYVCLECKTAMVENEFDWTPICPKCNRPARKKMSFEKVREKGFEIFFEYECVPHDEIPKHGKDYANAVMEHLNNAFSTMHRHVVQRYWSNGMYNYVSKAYYESDFQNGYYSAAYPTFANPYGMQFGLINVKVYNRPITQEDANTWFREFYRDHVRPSGRIDSRLHAVIAPASEGHKHLKGKYITRGTVHYLIVDPNPHRAVCRLIRQILEFLIKRLRGFLDSTHLDHVWTAFFKRRFRNPPGFDLTDYYFEEGREDSGVVSSIKNILNRRRNSELLANSVFCLARLWNYLRERLEEVKKALGFVDLHIRPVKTQEERDRELLENPSLIAKAKRILTVQLNVIKTRLRHLEDLERASMLLSGRYEAG